MIAKVDRIGCFRVLCDLALGAGSQGTVFKATCEREGFAGVRVGEIVALKVMSVLDADGSRYARLERRVSELHSLDSPNVVRYFGCFRERRDLCDLHVVVLEYLEGETLKARMRRCPCGLPREEAIRIATRTLEGLSYLSALGIVHRDLKPGNIFLTRNDGVKLIDFGVARAENGMTATTLTDNLIGTFDYMAPDFLDSSFSGDERSDVFSFGAVLHEMLVGRVPYAPLGETDQPGLQFVARWSGKGKSPVTIDSEIASGDPKLFSIVSRALAEDRKRRYANFREMLLDVWQLGGNAATLATQVMADGLPSPGLRHPRPRGRWIVLALCLPIVAAVAVLGFVRWPDAANALERLLLLAATRIHVETVQPVGRSGSGDQTTAVVAPNADSNAAENVVALPPVASSPADPAHGASPDAQPSPQPLAREPLPEGKESGAEDAAVAADAAETVLSAYRTAVDVSVGDGLREDWTNSWSDAGLPEAFVRARMLEFAEMRSNCVLRIRRQTALAEADALTNRFYRLGDLAIGDVRRRNWMSKWRPEDLPRGVWDLCRANFDRARTEGERHRVSNRQYAQIVAVRKAVDVLTNTYAQAASLRFADERAEAWLLKWSDGDLPADIYAECVDRLTQARGRRRRQDFEGHLAVLQRHWDERRQELERKLDAALRPGSTADPTVVQVKMYFAEKEFRAKVADLEKRYEIPSTGRLSPEKSKR